MTQDHDPFIAQMLQSAALRVHDAEACEERVFAMAPEAPSIADEDNVTADERDAIRDHLPAYAAWSDQYDAAKADRDDALRAHAAALRLATGVTVTADSASVAAHLVNVRGAAVLITAWTQPRAPRTTLPPGPAVARHARPRGAGRPRAGATRNSAKSGDSGEDGEPGEPPAAEHGEANR